MRIEDSMNFNNSRLDLKYRARTCALHFGEEGLPGVGRQNTIFACLQGGEGVGQDISSSREVIGGEEDTVIADLWFVEEPPAPSICERILIIEWDFGLHIS